MLDWLTEPILSVVYPRHCDGCGHSVESSRDGHACSSCWDLTRIFTGHEMLCTQCGAFFGPEPTPRPVRCHKCDTHHYRRAFALGIYEHALRASVLALKTTPNLPVRIRELIAEVAVRNGISYDLLMPTPLSKQRFLERGFNQAQVIAAFLSSVTGTPVDSYSLVRKIHTPVHRMGMDDRARELSVRTTFAVNRTKLIEGKSILLVDDVFTSGSTASACAQILKKNGAAEVDVFTLARAVLR